MAEQASIVAGGNDKLKRSAGPPHPTDSAPPRKRSRPEAEPAQRASRRQSTALSTRASASARSQRVATAESRGKKRQAAENQCKYPLRSQFRVNSDGALVPLSSPQRSKSVGPSTSKASRSESLSPRAKSTGRRSELLVSRKTEPKKPESRKSETAKRPESTKKSLGGKKGETGPKKAETVSKKAETVTKKAEAVSKRPAESRRAESGSRRSDSRRSSEGTKTGAKSKASAVGAACSTTGSCASSSRRCARAGKLPLDAPAMSADETAPPSTAAAPGGDDTAAAGAAHASAHANTSQPSASGLGGLGGGAAAGTSADSESDDGEVGRLQALLEARGLPPHLFGALGPRMQTLLHRSMGNSSSSKAQQLLQGLQASGDEGQQLQAVIEMCQMLVMGNEDTLAGFPVKQVVPALVTLLGMEHNFDMMNHACRALTYMMEALPRSSAVVVDAVPVFLEKLQVIQCMDVAEQALTGLEMLSRRHSKHILQARGVAACLMYLDFFSINAQRAALAVTANCCQNLHADEFHFVSKSLGLLADRLALQDKKSVESVCLAFSRLVDSFQHEPDKLVEIASPELLANLQQLLVVAPPVVSTGTFITALRMLSVMCANCPELALTLLRQNIAQTLCCLLTGAVSNAAHAEVELVARSPQELYEITSLIGELMPRLPSDGIFSVDALLDRPGAPQQDTVQWQWRDDRGLWHPYTTMDSRLMEAAHQGGEDEASLSTLGRAYTVDFHSMQQINEDTGTTRPVQRRLNPATLANNMADLLATPPPQPSIAAGVPPEPALARRSGCAREERCLAASFIRALFSTLYEVYSSSAGPAVRCKCLRALLRMVYLASPDLLKEVLKNQVVSSHIAGMMASQDLRIVVGALQMADILMQKLPDVFAVHFTREGVMHQIAQLADPEVPLAASPPKAGCVKSEPSTSSAADPTPPSTPQGPPPMCQAAAPGAAAGNGSGSDGPENAGEDVKPSASQLRLGDVLKRKRTPKRSVGTSRKARQDDSVAQQQQQQPQQQELFNKAPATSRSRFSSSKTSSFLASLNPARWGRAAGAGLLDAPGKAEAAGLTKSGSGPSLTAGNREKARAWVRDQAARFVEQHAAAPSSGASRSVLSRLTQAIARLQLEDEECVGALYELRCAVLESDISPFEVNHSGLVRALLAFVAGPGDRRKRLRAFLHVFAACPLDEEATIVEPKPAPLSALVLKLGGCVSQLEQFPVKVHDLPAGAGGGRGGGAGGGGGTSALKFFNTHQLKCNLSRHPACASLRQWKGGTVKIDPLALVQAIERYLVVRGYARLKDKEAADSDEDNSEEDIDDTLPCPDPDDLSSALLTQKIPTQEELAAVVISQGAARHRLQFLINGQVLPYNMTVYQAVRQFGRGADASETDTDNEAPLGNSGVWVHTHTIQYRPVEEEPAPGSAAGAGAKPGAASGRKGKAAGATAKAPRQRKPDALWADGVAPECACPLDALSPRLPETVTVTDASLDALALLRCLHALARHWGRLYARPGAPSLVPPGEFVSAKLAAKAGRQLQDPLVIMTGNLPGWLQQVAHACPFLFPFETRQLLFYATVFDRDRALQRLLDSAPELSTADSAERVTPRLERRKRVISRQDVLKQAEHLMHELASSRALLEVQYHDEVGTGLGPTLEFYALVSREMQRMDLELWHTGDAPAAPSPEVAYVDSPAGLFPSPLGRQAKSAAVARAKAKFRFLGKFMAKAVMDSRMLDLPLSVPLYRWLLGQESALGLADLAAVVPAVHATLSRLAEIGRQRQRIERSDTSAAQRKAAIEALSLDGCPLDQLGIDFTLPGNPSIELRRGGREITLSPLNVDQYVSLVTHWYLREGVYRQLEALREGFESVFPAAALRMFGPEELEAVFCGSTPAAQWDPRTLAECCRPDHGFTHESRAIRFLYEILSRYDAAEQRLFTQFVTGSPRLPVGGFKSLSPPLTVVRKTLELNMDPDDFLPSVMTCVNYLKLPDYTSIEVMRAKLSLAAREGQHSFHLS